MSYAEGLIHKCKEGALSILNDDEETTNALLNKEGLDVHQGKPLFGKSIPRKTKFMHISKARPDPKKYKFGGKKWTSEEIPPRFQTLFKKLGSKCVEVTNGKLNPNVVLVQCYDENGSIAPHADDEPEMTRDETTGLVKTIVSISIGATCKKFKVKKKKEGLGKRKRENAESIELRHGDILIMEEGTQEKFEHYIPKGEILGKRISLTFREQE